MFLCQATATLQQGQGHQNANLHAKFECHSLNIFPTIKVQVKAFVNFEMSEGQGHQTKKRLYRPLGGLYSQQT